MEALEVSDFWRDRPTLVTGATGLVGGWVVEALLERGAQPVCLVRDGIPRGRFVAERIVDRVVSVSGDVRDRDLIERTLGEYEIATVLHLAAQTLVGIANRNALSTFETNVGGTWAVLEACRRSPTVKQIVVASSDKAYGDHGGLPYSEDLALLGRHPYDASKACADVITQSYAQSFELPVAITRCGNFFGGGDLNWSRIVPGTIRSLIRGERPVIRSDGTYARDYFYVEDGAAAYLALAEALAERPEIRGEAFNFGYEQPLTVLDVVERVAALMRLEVNPDVQGVAKLEIPNQSLRCDKARSLLGWRPALEFDEGLRRTISWYRTHLAQWDRVGSA